MNTEKSSNPMRQRILMVIAIAPAVVMVFSFLFMMRSEEAFDDRTCPYRDDGEVRQVTASVGIREDVRECQEGVQERRWTLLRDGQDPLPLGVRRLRADLFGEGYRWNAEVEENRVVLRIYNPGIDPRVFREPGPDGLAEVEVPGATN